MKDQKTTQKKGEDPNLEEIKLQFKSSSEKFRRLLKQLLYKIKEMKRTVYELGKEHCIWMLMLELSFL